jgi:hypothetical protein
MTTLEFHIDSVGGTSAYTEYHREALHPTHICRFQIALNFFLVRRG